MTLPPAGLPSTRRPLALPAWVQFAPDLKLGNQMQLTRDREGMSKRVRSREYGISETLNTR
jgi:hypothetical protein